MATIDSLKVEIESKVQEAVADFLDQVKAKESEPGANFDLKYVQIRIAAITSTPASPEGTMTLLVKRNVGLKETS